MRNRGGPKPGTAPMGGAKRDDPRERLARQIQKINEGFWGTLHANTMDKSQYNQLMKSKEAQSFGALGPQNSLTKGMLAARTANSFLNASESSSLAFDLMQQGNAYAQQQNIGGSLATGKQNAIKLSQLAHMTQQER